MIENGETLRCLAVDDEPHALQLLGLYIDKVPGVELVHSTTSPLDALQWLKVNEVDLLFLDIQMNDLTGLQLLDVTDLNIPVILTTAYSEYALQSYEYKVSDYLLKPYSFERFVKAVEKVRAMGISYEKKEAVQHAEVKSGPDDIFIKGDSKNKFHRVPFKEIKYIEGLRNYIHIICNDQKIITLQNLKGILDELPENDFIRVHKSFIVNLNQVQLIEGHTIKIGDKRIPIGSSYRGAFYDRIELRR